VQELHAVELRHPIIHEDEVRTMLGCCGDSFETIAGAQHVVSTLLECHRNARSEVLLVVDDEHRLLAPGGWLHGSGTGQGQHKINGRGEWCRVRFMSSRGPEHYDFRTRPRFCSLARATRGSSSGKK